MGPRIAAQVVRLRTHQERQRAEQMNDIATELQSTETALHETQHAMKNAGSPTSGSEAQLFELFGYRSRMQVQNLSAQAEELNQRLDVAREDTRAAREQRCIAELVQSQGQKRLRVQRDGRDQRRIDELAAWNTQLRNKTVSED